MSAIDILAKDASERTGATPEAVRAVLVKGVRHIPEGTKINRESMAAALQAARSEPGGVSAEESKILDYLGSELNSLGRLKQALVFGAISANIGELRQG